LILLKILAYTFLELSTTSVANIFSVLKT